MYVDRWIQSRDMLDRQKVKHREEEVWMDVTANDQMKAFCSEQREDLVKDKIEDKIGIVHMADYSVINLILM